MCWEKSVFSPEVAEFSDFGVGLQSTAGLLAELGGFSSLLPSLAHYFDLPRILKAFT